MKTYQCHKRVKARKIADVQRDGCWIHLRFEDGTKSSLANSQRFDAAEVGGYHVICDEGGVSYWPAAAFEAGYSEVPA